MKNAFIIEEHMDEMSDRIAYIVSSKKEALRRVKYLNEHFARGVELNAAKTDIEDTPENDRILDEEAFRYFTITSYELDGIFYDEAMNEKSV